MEGGDEHLFPQFVLSTNRIFTLPDVAGMVLLWCFAGVVVVGNM